MTPADRGARLVPGAEVQSPFGRGVVRDVRNNGRVLVEVQGRAVLMEERTLTLLVPVAASRRRAQADDRSARDVTDGATASEPTPARQQRVGQASHVRELDLHGLTVEEALVRMVHVLDGAMRDDVVELRVIHGRSGGRLRAALHRHLKAIPSIRAFLLDPRNEGVTIIRL